MRSQKGCSSFQSLAVMLFGLNRRASHFQVTLGAKTHGTKNKAKLRTKATAINTVGAPLNLWVKNSKCMESKANTAIQLAPNISQWTRNHGAKIWEAVESWPHNFWCKAMILLSVAWLIEQISLKHTSTKLLIAHVNTTNTQVHMNAVR